MNIKSGKHINDNIDPSVTDIINVIDKYIAFVGETTDMEI